MSRSGLDRQSALNSDAQQEISPVVISLAVCLGAALAIWRAFKTLRVDSYLYTQYLFDYQEEFLKRGLIGEILTQLQGSVRYEAIQTLGLVQLILYGLALAIACLAIPRFVGRSASTLVFVVFAITCSATLQHFIFDLGRVDVLLVNMMMVSGLLLLATTSWPAILSIMAMAIVALLIHEAAFFMTLPVILAAWIYIDGWRKGVVSKLVCAGIIVAVTYAISTTGLSDTRTFDEHLADLTDAYGDRVSAYSLEVLFMDLEGNLAFTAEHGVNRGRIFHHSLLFLFLAPVFYFVFRLFQALLRDRNMLGLLVMLATLSPLLLYPLGHDHFRWWALAINNATLATIFLAFRRDRTVLALFDSDKRAFAVLAAAIPLALISGPLLVNTSFWIAPDIAAFIGLSGPWAGQ